MRKPEWLIIPITELTEQDYYLLNIIGRVYYYKYVCLCIYDLSNKPNTIQFTNNITQYDKLVTRQEFIDTFLLQRLENIT